MSKNDWIIQRIINLVKSAGEEEKAYLAEQLEDFEDLGRLARTVRLAEPLSRLHLQARFVANNPIPYTTKLTGEWNNATAFLQKDFLAQILMFHYAQRKWGKHAERYLEDGHALRVLAAEPDPPQTIRLAAEAAATQFSAQKLIGKGGARRKQDPAIAIAAQHVLEIYQAVTGKMPGVSVRSGTVSAEEQIRGPAVEFLLLSLELMGFLITRSKARLSIDAYRARARLINN